MRSTLAGSACPYMHERGIVETRFLSLIDERGGYSDGNMGFARASSPEKDQIMGIYGKLARAKLLDLRFSHSRYAVVKCGKILVVRELRNPHLIFYGSHPSFDCFRFNQMFQGRC
ncbi:MAG: hypothetical protein ACI9HB_002795 [Gammaproteobacteria bacterium]|jgi:hypothetical protein